jgi:hypothetical protein
MAMNRIMQPQKKRCEERKQSTDDAKPKPLNKQTKKGIGLRGENDEANRYKLKAWKGEKDTLNIPFCLSGGRVVHMVMHCPALPLFLRSSKGLFESCLLLFNSIEFNTNDMDRT